MPAPSLPLRATRLEVSHGNPHWNTGPAVVTVRPIGERPATPKPQPHQFAVDAAVDQVAGGRDLRPRHAVRQITAGIRRGGVKLERRQRKVVEFGHGRSAWSAGG